MTGPISAAASSFSNLSKLELADQITGLAGHHNAGTYLNLALEVLFQRVRLAKRVSAETSAPNVQENCHCGE